MRRIHADTGRVALLIALLFPIASLSFGQGKNATKVVSLGRVAQALKLTRVYSRPSVRSHIYYNVQPKEFMVVKAYNKGSPWKLVLLQNMQSNPVQWIAATY